MTKVDYGPLSRPRQNLENRGKIQVRPVISGFPIEESSEGKTRNHRSDLDFPTWSRRFELWRGREGLFRRTEGQFSIIAKGDVDAMHETALFG